MIPHIAFVINRSSTAKQWIPLIQEALHRSWPVTILAGPLRADFLSPHALYHPQPENVLFPGKEQVAFLNYQGESELPALIRRQALTDVFVPDLNHSPHRAIWLQAQQEQKLRLYSTQWFGDFLTATPPEWLQHFDSFFVYSDFMRQIYGEVYPQASHDLLKKLIVTGNPLLDTLPSIQQNHRAIRQKYGLPPDKKVVLFFTQDLYPYFLIKEIFLNHNRLRSFWKSLRQGQWGYLKEALWGQRYYPLLRSLKTWCQANQACLVVKTRLKHHEPSFMATLADFLLTDTTTWYPPQSLELAAIADLVISSFSGTVLEAAAVGTYHLNLAFPYYIDPAIYKSAAFFNEELFHTPGATESWLYDEFIDKLKKYRLEDFSQKINPPVRAAYSEKNLGPIDGRSSSRILNHLLV